MGRSRKGAAFFYFPPVSVVLAGKRRQQAGGKKGAFCRRKGEGSYEQKAAGRKVI